MAAEALDLLNATTKRGTIKCASDLASGLLLWHCCYRYCIVHHMSLIYHCYNIYKFVDTELSY